MNKNQFFYTYKNQEGKEVIGSFNVECVVRSFSLSTGGLVVILNDGREQPMDVPVEKQSGKKTVRIVERRREYLQSEIELTLEDSKRFIAISSIDNFNN